jgi:four helix bundle protein
MATINSFKELIVYQKAYKLAMEIFEVSKAFPKEEKYSLTDQIRRSSKSISANIAEAWARKKYIKSFVNKLTDSLGEEFETEVWLDFAKDSQYLSKEDHARLTKDYDEVRKMLISMIANPDKFFRPNS